MSDSVGAPGIGAADRHVFDEYEEFLRQIFSGSVEIARFSKKVMANACFLFTPYNIGII